MTASLAPAAVLGLLIGSFLNVVAWRLPRGESLVAPGSHCPHCEAPVKPYDNVPVLSWLLLRGRCRGCRERISARYPVVEAVTALLWAGVVAVAWGEPERIALGVALVTLLVPVTLIDLEHRIIPNRLTGPFALLAVGLGAALAPDRLPEQLLAAAGAGGFLLAAALANPRGMGMGDVKLAAVLGLYLGRAVAPALLVALVAGVLAGLAVMARKGVAEGRRTKVPFGPFLALGALVGLVAGDPLMDAYLERF